LATAVAHVVCRHVAQKPAPAVVICVETLASSATQLPASPLGAALLSLFVHATNPAPAAAAATTSEPTTNHLRILHSSREPACPRAAPV
jgi:hypothetical protein